ncbi:AAA family ATPase, partial [Bacillus cereus group sp. Bce037]|uniref:AAA family ATPase n=1 Tax=Bacillus cereus group sp. Bce037 TaxID=3445232 RepID=UPI003F2142A3
FANGVTQDRGELDRRIHYQLAKNSERLGLPAISYADIPDAFAELIDVAHREYGQPVVILIDEYDKPILDNILKPERARELREGLKNLY